MLLEGNSNDVVQTMRRDDTGAAITDAVMTAKMYDPHGTLVDTISMSHAGSGEYRGTTTANVVVGAIYTFDIKASNYQFRRIVREPGLSPLNIL